MTEGYTADDNLDTAMQAWTCGEAIDMGHIYAVTRKHLRTVDKVQYVAYLQEYGLLQKLFGLEDSDDLNYLLIALEGKIREAPQGNAREQHGFFLPQPQLQPEVEEAYGIGAGLYDIGSYVAGYVSEQCTWFTWGK